MHFYVRLLLPNQEYCLSLQVYVARGVANSSPSAAVKMVVMCGRVKPECRVKTPCAAGLLPKRYGRVMEEGQGECVEA